MFVGLGIHRFTSGGQESEGLSVYRFFSIVAFLNNIFWVILILWPCQFRSLLVVLSVVCLEVCGLLWSLKTRLRYSSWCLEQFGIDWGNDLTSNEIDKLDQIFHAANVSWLMRLVSWDNASVKKQFSNCAILFFMMKMKAIANDVMFVSGILQWSFFLLIKMNIIWALTRQDPDWVRGYREIDTSLLLICRAILLIIDFVSWRPNSCQTPFTAICCTATFEVKIEDGQREPVEEVDCLVADVVKSLSRCAWRTDGLAPTWLALLRGWVIENWGQMTKEATQSEEFHRIYPFVAECVHLGPWRKHVI